MSRSGCQMGTVSQNFKSVFEINLLPSYLGHPRQEGRRTATGSGHCGPRTAQEAQIRLEEVMGLPNCLWGSWTRWDRFLPDGKMGKLDERRVKIDSRNPGARDRYSPKVYQRATVFLWPQPGARVR